MGELYTTSQTCFFVFSDRNHTHKVLTVLRCSPLLRKVREAKSRFSVSCRIVVSRGSNLGQLSSFLSSIRNSIKTEPSLTSVSRAQAWDIYPPHTKEVCRALYCPHSLSYLEMVAVEVVFFPYRFSSISWFYLVCLLVYMSLWVHAHMYMHASVVCM